MFCYTLVLDASGSSKDPVGVGGMAYLGNFRNTLRFQHIKWPHSFITGADRANIDFRHKTTLLEALGITSLVIHLAEVLQNQVFHMKVNNRDRCHTMWPSFLDDWLLSPRTGPYLGELLWT